MLDRKFILENVQAVIANCKNRGVTCDIEQLVVLENQRKAKLQDALELNRLANETSKAIGKASSNEEREQLKEKGRLLREQKDAAQTEHDQLDLAIRALEIRIPNMTHPAAPIGKDDAANTEIARGNTPVPTFDFKAKDHLELGKMHDLIDFEAGARVAGAGFCGPHL